LDRSSLLKSVLLIEIIILLGNAVAILRDYEDSWILEGLEIPFMLFVATFALAFFSEKSSVDSFVGCYRAIHIPLNSKSEI